MYNPFPVSGEIINWFEGHYNPSSVKYMNNETFEYWQRALFQRACSVFDLTLPEEWKGTVRDFFQWVLFSRGFLMVTELPQYGKIFQPCTKGADRNIYYQPKTVLIMNPYMEDLNKQEFIIGENCELVKLTPDFRGIFDIISYYAEQLANIQGSCNMAQINSKIAAIIGAKTKGAGEALKKAIDLLQQGNPAVIYDQRIANSQDDKDIPFQFLDLSHISAQAIDGVEKLLMDMQTTLNNFDTEVGIPTLPFQKKERMVTSEAESKVVDSTSRSIVWLKCLEESFEKVNSMYGMDLKVELRFDPDDMMDASQEQAQTDNPAKEGGKR